MTPAEREDLLIRSQVLQASARELVATARELADEARENCKHLRQFVAETRQLERKEQARLALPSVQPGRIVREPT